MYSKYKIISKYVRRQGPTPLPTNPLLPHPNSSSPPHSNPSHRHKSSHTHPTPLTHHQPIVTHHSLLTLLLPNHHHPPSRTHRCIRFPQFRPSRRTDCFSQEIRSELLSAVVAQHTNLRTVGALALLVR